MPGMFPFYVELVNKLVIHPTHFMYICQLCKWTDIKLHHWLKSVYNGHVTNESTEVLNSQRVYNAHVPVSLKAHALLIHCV